MRNKNETKYETRNLHASTTYVEGEEVRSGSGGGGGRDKSGFLHKRTRVMGFQVRTVYLLIAGVVAIFIASYMVIRLLSTQMAVHFGMLAGILLLLGNVREFLRRTYTSPNMAPDNSTPLMNSLIGGSLVCVWLASISTDLFWLLAIVLLLISVPLVLARATAYTMYVETAKRILGSFRHAVRRP